MRGLAAVPRLLTPIALLAAALAIVVPSGELARHSDLLLAALDRERDGIAALAVALLVYAALSGTHGAHDLAAAALASLAFLAVCAVLGELWRRHAAPDAAVPGALAIGMRDFAVAAALATQAFGISAGTVPGVYGVLMLVAGTVAAGRLRAAN